MAFQINNSSTNLAEQNPNTCTIVSILNVACRRYHYWESEAKWSNTRHFHLLLKPFSLDCRAGNRQLRWLFLLSFYYHFSFQWSHRILHMMLEHFTRLLRETVRIYTFSLPFSLLIDQLLRLSSLKEGLAAEKWHASVLTDSLDLRSEKFSDSWEMGWNFNLELRNLTDNWHSSTPIQPLF